MPGTLSSVSTFNSSDLEVYITGALEQIVYNQCEPSLNSIFWADFRAIREREKAALVCANIGGQELQSLLRANILHSLHTLGWRGFTNNDGCVEFYKV